MSQSDSRRALLSSILCLAGALACEKKSGGGDEGSVKATHPGVKNLLVLMYHDIRDCADGTHHAADLLANDDVCLSNFKQQMEWLKSNDFDFISPYDLLTAREVNKRLPSKSVIVTFDDNYWGVTEYAVPFMQSAKVKGTVFVHTGYVPKEDPKWSERMSSATTDKEKQEILAEWKEADKQEALTDYKAGSHPKASWRAIVEAEIRNKGETVKYESHTVNHVDVSKLPLKEAEEELEKSKASLEENFKRMLSTLGRGSYVDLVADRRAASGDNKRVAFLAYPYGGTSARVIKASRAAGYRLAFEVGFTEDHGDQSFTLPREGIGRSVKTLDRFESLVNAYMKNIR